MLLNVCKSLSPRSEAGETLAGELMSVKILSTD